MKTCVLIPAYNSAHFLPEVVSRIPLLESKDEIIIVDDASDDKTIQVARSLPSVFAVRNSFNLGYGGTSLKLYKLALEREADFTVNIHADLGHRPEDVSKISQQLLTQKWDIVTGSRLIFIMDTIAQNGWTSYIKNPKLRGKMPLHRVFGHIIITFIQNQCYRTRLHSFHDGMRGCNRRTIEWIVKNDFSSWYNFDAELLIRAHQNKFLINEVPISPFYDPRAKSAAPPIRYGLTVLSKTFRDWLNIS